MQTSAVWSAKATIIFTLWLKSSISIIINDSRGRFECPEVNSSLIDCCRCSVMEIISVCGTVKVVGAFIFNVPTSLLCALNNQTVHLSPSLKKYHQSATEKQQDEYKWTCKILLQFRCWELFMCVLPSLAFILHDALFWEICILTQGMFVFFSNEGAPLLPFLCISGARHFWP